MELFSKAIDNETHSEILSPTIAHGNIKNEIRQIEKK